MHAMSYSGKISETVSMVAPFLVTITDETGHLFGAFPAGTRADAEDRLSEALTALLRLSE